MGKALGSVTNMAAGLVSPILGSITGGALGDQLFGKEDPGTAASLMNTNSLEGQKYSTQALDKYGEMLNQNTDQMAANQTELLSNQARANVDDQTRRAQQMVAQRGLGNSSVGMNAILNQGANLGNQLGAIKANQPMLGNQMKQQNLQFASNGIANAMGAQNQGMVYNKAVASQGRLGGGIAPLLVQGGAAYAKAGAGA